MKEVSSEMEEVHGEMKEVRSVGSKQSHISVLISYLSLLLITLTCFADLVHAQSGGSSGAYTRMGFGPRGMGMGNAIASVTQQGIYAHYNPALAASATGNQIDMASAAMRFDRSLHTLNATFKLPPSAGLNVGLLNANVTNIDGRSQSGYHTDYLSTHEFQAFAAFGLQVSQRVHLGVGVKAYMADFHEDLSNATGAGFDIGLLIKPANNIQIGLSAQDILAAYRWDTSDLYGTQSARNRTDHFPTRFKIAASWLSGNERLVISSEFEIRRLKSETIQRSAFTDLNPPQNRRLIENIITSSNIARVGASYLAHERITVRGGWQMGDLDIIADSHKPSAGFSVHLPFDKFQPSVDYAFVREPTGIANMHVFALRLKI
ncbi:MAG: hypothetical protein WD491_11515 [Balneolales bacterium]